MRRCTVAAAAAAALTLAPSASAHGSIAPTVARPGGTQRFTVIVLNGRNDAVVGFRLELPPGATLHDRATRQHGWTDTSTANRVEWRGGQIPPNGSEPFTLRARMPATEGTVSFTGREIFADGLGPPFRLDVVLAGSGSARHTDEDSLGQAKVFLAIAGGLLLMALGLLARRRHSSADRE